MPGKAKNTWKRQEGEKKREKIRFGPRHSGLCVLQLDAKERFICQAVVKKRQHKTGWE